MPQSSMNYDEILAAFETVHERDLYQTRETVYTKPEGEKEYRAADGAKLPKRGAIVHLDPFTVAFSDFHDRKFGHSYGIRRNEKGEVTALGHIEQLALRIHDEGQLEDCAGVLRRRGEGEMAVQVWRGTGRTLAVRLLMLSGVVPDAQVRIKIVDTVTSEDPDTMKALVTATVNANLTSAGYSAVDKANIFRQMIDGTYSGVSYTQEEIARVTGVTPASISQLMNITRMLPEVQRLIHEDRIGYAKALALKLHKMTEEEQRQWIATFAETGGKKGKHAASGNGDGDGPQQTTVKELRGWCSDVINSTAHKQGSKDFCRVLLEALTSRVSTVKDLDDTLERVVKGR